MTLLSVFYFLLPFTSMNGADRHEFHISICDIKYVSSSQSVQVTQKIFLDDLEKALIVFGDNPTIDVMQPKNPKQLDSLVVQYVKNHFYLAINQRVTELLFLGSEVKDDIMVVYAEVSAVKSLKSIKITNDVLIDLFPDQMNIVHCQNEGQTKSIRLTKSQINDTILFE